MPPKASIFEYFGVPLGLHWTKGLHWTPWGTKREAKGIHKGVLFFENAFGTPCFCGKCLKYEKHDF